MPKGPPIVGIDLGGTNMQVGVVDDAGHLLGRAKKKTRATEGQDRVIDRIVEGVHEACAAAGLTPRDVAAVGIGAPGAIEPVEGVVLQAPNLRWTDVPVAKILSRRLARPVILDNDVNAAVYGEHRLGAGRGVPDLMGVWIGTGIGGGFIFHGRLYHGATFTAGEIGHVTLFPGAPPGSTSLEHNCSRTAIVDRLLRLVRANRKSILPDLADTPGGEIKARAVAQAYAKGDKLTMEVVDNAARMLAVGIANAVTLLGLPRVVVGGGLTEAMGETLVAVIRAEVRRLVFPDVCKSVEVVCTELEADAGLIGAALIARERIAQVAARTKPPRGAPATAAPRNGRVLPARAGGGRAK